MTYTAKTAQNDRRKIIITVQHTESEHHLNGHAGAWGKWNLTAKGRQQAFEVGKWLLGEDCHQGFIMYCSDQPRALQTAEEMNKSLHLTPVYSELIREASPPEELPASLPQEQFHILTRQAALTNVLFESVSVMPIAVC